MTELLLPAVSFLGLGLVVWLGGYSVGWITGLFEDLSGANDKE